MKLLRLSVFFSAFLLTISICNAQNKKPKKTLDQKSIEMTKKLSSEVKLTKIQAEKINEINKIYLKNKEVLEVKIEVLDKEKKKLKNERNSKIDAILTVEQKKKHEASKKKKKK